NEFRRGIQAFNRGSENVESFSDAEAYFDLASEIQPDSASAYVNRAFALLNAGRSAEAITPLESALERGDSQPETFIFLGDLYRQRGDTDKAFELFQRAAEIHPDNPDIQSQLLNAYVESGQVDKAMEEYVRAVERDPDNKLYRYNLGSLLLEAERYDEAIEHLARAVEVDPDYANAQYNLGAAYVNKAVELSEEISAKDDELRAQRAQLSNADIQQRESEIERLATERRGLFAEAVSPLEMAKTLMEASGEDPSGVCQALFSAYVQTDQQQKAQSIAECAGYEDIN
ncbi:MAG: tetratricopeptide repeat protein, partial [Rhodothermales bacterium]